MSSEAGHTWSRSQPGWRCATPASEARRTAPSVPQSLAVILAAIYVCLLRLLQLALLSRSRSSSSASNSRFFGATRRGQRTGQPIVYSSPPPAGSSAEIGGGASLSRPTRCCDGTAISLPESGRDHTARQDGHRSRLTCATWSAASHARTLAGATSGSVESCSSSASASRPRRSLPSSALPASIPRRAGVCRGGRSCAPRHTRS